MPPIRLILATLLVLPAGGCLGLDYFLEDTGLPNDTDIDVDVDTDTDADVDSDTDTDTDPQTGTIAIDSIEPNYGSNGGGTIVEIRGGPFNQSTEVKLGNAATTVLQVNQNLMRVETPVSSQEGTVDVSITNENASGSVKNGFTYWPDATGLGGAYGEIRWIRWLGDYWNGGPPESTGYAWWTLVDPTSEHFYHWAYAPADDTCSRDYFYQGTISNFNLGLSSTSLSVNNRTITLSDTSGQQIFDAELISGDFVANGNYSLDEIFPTTFPSFSVPGLATPPGNFVVSNPYLDGTMPPTVGRSFAITWSGATADRMVIIIERLDINYNVVETISCVAINDGSFQIPSSAFSGWESNGIVMILVGALNEGGGGTFPFNNSESWVSGTNFVAGGAYTQ
ncbi:MAG: IPT/TIG domain-containing protein [Myxococcota bacterium]|nr:IPT/TIG domain-containing protein [Myxococcota bacterium]